MKRSFNLLTEPAEESLTAINLAEITSDNPFLRLSRSKIRELNIPTLIHINSKSQEKEIKKIKKMHRCQLSKEQKNIIEETVEKKEEKNNIIETPKKLGSHMKNKSVNKYSSPSRKSLSHSKNADPIESLMSTEEYINLLTKKIEELIDSVAHNKRIHTRVVLNALSTIINRYIDFSFFEAENIRLKDILQKAFDCIRKLNLFEVKYYLYI